MKAFWWYDENSIAGMARPGFNSVHWLELPFDEAAMLGWVGQYFTGKHNLEAFRRHLATYVPQIYVYHKLDKDSGARAIKVFEKDEGILQVIDRLNKRTNLLKSFSIQNDQLDLVFCEQKLRSEIEFLKSHNIQTLVALTESHHSADLLRNDFELHHLSIPDLGAPNLDQAKKLAEVIRDLKQNKRRMAMHCLAGIGRTSTMMIAAHMLLGETFEDQMQKIAKQNPRFALSPSQERFLKQVSAFASVKKMWSDYHASIGVSYPPEPVADHFCDNEKDANELADLVNKGIKRATAGSLWSYEKTNTKMPEVGSAFVVTDWFGKPVCVVKTTKVDIVPFNQVTEAQAYREGEGDRSLEYWRRVHINFFKNEFKELGLTFDESMPVVFEEFEKVYP